MAECLCSKHRTDAVVLELADEAPAGILAVERAAMTAWRKKMDTMAASPAARAAREDAARLAHEAARNRQVDAGLAHARQLKAATLAQLAKTTVISPAPATWMRIGGLPDDVGWLPV